MEWMSFLGVATLRDRGDVLAVGMVPTDFTAPVGARRGAQMLTTRWLNAALAIALVAGSTAPQGGKVGAEQGSGHPFPPAGERWIPATDLVDVLAGRAEGESRAAMRARSYELFPSREAATAEGDRRVPGSEPMPMARILAAPGPDCWFTTDFRHYNESGLLDQSTFRKMVGVQKSILTGRVTGVQGGFGDGGPGLLVQVEVSEWLKRDPAVAAPEVVHFFYPRGEFSVGDARVCAQARGWPPAPELGAEILVASFIGLDADDNPSLLWLESPGGPVAFDVAGLMHTTEDMRKLHQEFRVTELSELERLVRDEIARQRQEGIR